MRICFFGTPDFASFSLKLSIKHGYNIVCVVTAPDKPKGRGLKLEYSDVKKTALELGIPVLQPTNLKSEEFAQELKAYNIDLGLIIAFRMLPEKIWNMPKMGTFNLHASLLPNYRGAAPINHAIINGESKTGVTTFFLKHDIDTGDILLQNTVDIENIDTVGTLYLKLMQVGGQLVLDSLKIIKTGNYTLVKQILTGAEKHAPKIFRPNCEIKYTYTAKYAFNLWRGLSPFPGAWLSSPKLGECKIIEAELSPKIFEGDEIRVFEGELFYPLVDGSLKITQIRLPGKNTQLASEIINGYFK